MQEGAPPATTDRRLTERFAGDAAIQLLAGQFGRMTPLPEFCWSKSL